MCTSHAVNNQTKEASQQQKQAQVCYGQHYATFT